MTGSLCVPRDIQERLLDFLNEEGIDLDIVDGADCTVQVVNTDERRRCGLRRLYPGGFIACETARGAAVKLGIRTRQMGKLLDFLNIKVRNCALGCFK